MDLDCKHELEHFNNEALCVQGAYIAVTLQLKQ